MGIQMTSNRAFYSNLLPAVLLGLIGLIFTAAPALAAGPVVNTNVDENDGECVTTCSLRDAIATANPGETITFDANYTITLASQLPAIAKTVTIIGNGAANTIIQANDNPGVADYRVFEVDSTGDLTLDSLSVRNGQCNGACATSGTRGGGVYNLGALTIKNSVFSGNGARYGGAIRNYDTGTLTVTNSTFADNSAEKGGGIYNSNILSATNSTFADNSATSEGGGIYNRGNTLTVTNSTFSGNSASYAGGIYNESEIGNCSSTPAVTISNSTFSGNSADYAGGIYNYQGVISLLFNTITASSSGGGVWSYNDSTTCTKASGNIIAGNTGGDVRADDTAQRFASSGYNLIGTAGDKVDFTQEFNQTGDQVNVADPKLGPLGNYGGPTQTLPLLPGSPAIDAGASCPAADQRGVTRSTPTCDIGAFESRGFTFTYGGGSGQSALLNTTFASPLTLTVTSAHTEPVDSGWVILSGPSSGAGVQPVVYTATISHTMITQVVTANNTVGGYVVTATARGNLGSAVSFNLTNRDGDVSPIYLPLVVRGFATAPDLVITSLSSDANGPRVVIRNAGNAAVVDGFWVDVYFNPRETPSLNKTWSMIAPAGAVWGITESMDTGETITLTVGGPYYQAAYSSPRFPSGAQVYAQVDSVDTLTDYGGVLESNETNNVAGPVISTAEVSYSGAGEILPPATTALPTR
jgi:CSLREA domain-containing protein